MHGYFNNSLKLVKFILKRERIMSSVWIIILALFSVMPLLIENMFVTEAELLVMAETMKNPAMIAMMGPVYGTENYSVAAMYSNMMLLMTIVTVAIMNIFLVVRHTRGDEEKGREEVVRSLPVGRLAKLNATMIMAVILNIVIALVCGIIMSLLGIESMNFGGSMLFGAAVGVSGLFFAAVAALFSQLCSSSRSSVCYSLVFMGFCYVLRAVGDTNNEILSLISPMGLILRTKVYVENNLLPFFVLLLLTAIATIKAYYFDFIRDLGQGFIPAKPGRKNASVMLQSSFGLAFRLSRNMLIGWAITMFAIGVSYGSIMGDIEVFISENAFYQQMIPQSPDYSLTEIFITMINSILALICAIPVIATVLKLKGEEKNQRLEHILSRAVSRTTYLLCFVIISVATSFIMLFSSIYGLWLASSFVLDNAISFGSMLKAIMVYLPALWFMIGITVLLIGILPNATGFNWAYIGFSFFVVYLGRTLSLSEWLNKLTPFGYIPQLPIEEVNNLTLIILTCLSVILMVLGFYFYRNRDMK